MIKESRGDRIFKTCVILIVILIAFLCLMPFLNIVSISMSSKTRFWPGEVYFWPKGSGFFCLQRCLYKCENVAFSIFYDCFDGRFRSSIHGYDNIVRVSTGKDGPKISSAIAAFLHVYHVFYRRYDSCLSEHQ